MFGTTVFRAQYGCVSSRRVYASVRRLRRDPNGRLTQELLSRCFTRRSLLAWFAHRRRTGPIWIQDDARPAVPDGRRAPWADKRRGDPRSGPD